MKTWVKKNQSLDFSPDKVTKIKTWRLCKDLDLNKQERQSVSI